jgi:uncharacterized protein (DUF1697 family)
VASGTRHLVLLRGINVGGKNIIKMPALRAAFEEMGFEDVTSFIASGNVFFHAPRQKRADLAARVEKELTAAFKTDLRVVIVDAGQMRKVIDEAPKGFGGSDYRCDTLFLRKPLTPAKVLKVSDPRDGIDQVWAGPGVVYWSRLDAKASGSRLSKVASMPEYKNMTVRSWSSTTKLAKLMAAD